MCKFFLILKKIKKKNSRCSLCGKARGKGIYNDVRISGNTKPLEKKLIKKEEGSFL